MIPLRDENPSKTIPVVNTCLILANLSVFVYQNLFVPGEDDFGPKDATLRPHLTHIPTVSVRMSATWRGTAPLTLTVGVKTPPNQSLSSLSNQGHSVKCVGLAPELYIQLWRGLADFVKQSFTRIDFTILFFGSISVSDRFGS